MGKSEISDYLGWHRDLFGLASALRAAMSLAARGPARASVPIPGGRIWLRPGTTDQRVFEGVFVRRDYAVGIGQAEYIVDAGAHIGCASVFFGHLFPAAHIVAVEPEEGNFQLLVRNLAHLRAAHPVRGALWSHSTELAIWNPWKETWSYRVSSQPTSSVTVPAYSVEDLIQRYALPRIDVLKIDIEGAEIEALQEAPRWIDRVGTLIVEVHEKWRPGCAATVEAAVAGQRFTRRYASSGHVIIFERGV